MARPKSFLGLPQELRLVIKEHLGEYDLLGHVCYRQLCPETRACYDKIGPTFWRNLLRMNGLGDLEDEAFASDAYWMSVAIKCAEHAWSCSHPACGVARLEENRRLMQIVRGQWEDWMLDEAIPDPKDGENGEEGGIFPSSVFEHVSFNNEFADRFWQKFMGGAEVDIGTVAFLRREVVPPAPAWTKADLLDKHPIAMRTFAVIPPLRTVKMLNFESVPPAESLTGVTVRDVLTQMGERLHHDLTVEDLSERLSMVGNAPRGGIFPSTWKPTDLLEAARKLGNFFQLTDWAGLEYEENDGENRYFSFNFNYKALPASASVHLLQYDPDLGYLHPKPRHVNAAVQTDV